MHIRPPCIRRSESRSLECAAVRRTTGGHCQRSVAFARGKLPLRLTRRPGARRFGLLGCYYYSLDPLDSISLIIGCRADGLTLAAACHSYDNILNLFCQWTRPACHRDFKLANLPTSMGSRWMKILALPSLATEQQKSLKTHKHWSNCSKNSL